MAITTKLPSPESRQPKAAKPPTKIGAALSETGEMIRFGTRAIIALPRSSRYISEALTQSAAMARSTWLLMFVMNVFLGITVTNFGFFLLRSLGASDYLGVFTGLLGTRFTGLQMFGYVFAGKICCGIAAELGAMKIQQEVDAYTSEGVDTNEYLVGTRVLAVLFFLPLAAALALIGQTAGNFFAAVVVLQGISAEQLAVVHWSVQSVGDQFNMFIGTVLIAVPATLVACFCGLRARGGPASVGTAAANSMVINLVLVHAVVGSVAVLFWGTSLRTPIGG